MFWFCFIVLFVVRKECLISLYVFLYVCVFSIGFY